MFFFALANMALALLYHVFEWKDIAQTGYGIFAGVALSLLLNYVKGIRPAGEMILVIALTDLVVLVLFYGYMSIWTNVHLDFLMLCLVLGAGFCALLALVHFVTAKEKVRSVLGWAAFCATGMNSLPLIAYLLK